MDISPRNPAIHLNEVVLRDDDQWLHFKDPYAVIRADHLQDVLSTLQQVDLLVNTRGWHAAGFVSYEAASAFDPALVTRASHSPSGDHARQVDLPYLWFGLYPAPRTITLPKPSSMEQTQTWQPAVGRAEYDAAIERIKAYIADGRTYQVNYTMPLRTGFDQDPWNFFLRLSEQQNQYVAYIDTGRFVICSASPELFFQLDGESITCRPMKGTAKRGRTGAEDKAQSEWLRNSEKNRAENIMIVDMLRNDLGRIARIGSIQVPQLFEVQRFSTLWQMTSTVTAQTNVTMADIFSALFPCASITGAPKAGTTKIIAELEGSPRKIYTGSIGYLSPDRKAKFNVAIRTVLIDREVKKAEYGVGGGIVWDSNAAEEYSEMLLKARVLTEIRPEFSLLETMLWTPEAGFFLRDKHLDRLLESADYFDIPASRGKLDEFLARIPMGSGATDQRVRLLLDQTGALAWETAPLSGITDTPPLKIQMAARPVDSKNVFLFHKTTQRGIYNNARREHPDADDILFYNEYGELTEFTIGNLVVERNSGFYTPPVSCGLLPGIFRAHLLETGQIREAVIRVDELESCVRIFRVNSVRQWQEARIGK